MFDPTYMNVAFRLMAFSGYAVLFVFVFVVVVTLSSSITVT